MVSESDFMAKLNAMMDEREKKLLGLFAKQTGIDPEKDARYAEHKEFMARFAAEADEEKKRKAAEDAENKDREKRKGWGRA